MSSVAPSSTDFTYTAVAESLYALLEANLSAMVASLPTLRPVLSKVGAIPSMWSRASGDGSGAHPYAYRPGGLELEHGRQSKFQRLEDGYELGIMSLGGHRPGLSSTTATARGGDKAIEEADMPHESDVINVKREMQVLQTPRGDSDASGDLQKG